MIELVLSICLIAEPHKCKDVRLSFAEQSVSTHSCLMNGQIEIAKWMDGHPTWQVAKWSCGRAGVYAKA